jgi:hypothetical protein
MKKDNQDIIRLQTNVRANIQAREQFESNKAKATGATIPKDIKLLKSLNAFRDNSFCLFLLNNGVSNIDFINLSFKANTRCLLKSIPFYVNLLRSCYYLQFTSSNKALLSLMLYTKEQKAFNKAELKEKLLQVYKPDSVNAHINFFVKLVNAGLYTCKDSVYKPTCAMGLLINHLFINKDNIRIVKTLPKLTVQGRA